VTVVSAAAAAKIKPSYSLPASKAMPALASPRFAAPPLPLRYVDRTPWKVQPPGSWHPWAKESAGAMEKGAASATHCPSG